MKAIFTRYVINNMLHETGDDVIQIDVFFKTAEKPEITSPYILPYEKLLRFIKQDNEAVYNYLAGIRNGLHGYGPRHSKVFAVLEDESFDLQPFIKLYIESIAEDIIDDCYARSERKLPKEERKKLEQHLQKLDDILNDDFVQYNINFTAFQDELDKSLHELTFKYFPELFEKGDAYVEKYRNRLSRTVTSFASDIGRIMSGNL